MNKPRIGAVEYAKRSFTKDFKEVSVLKRFTPLIFVAALAITFALGTGHQAALADVDIGTVIHATTQNDAGVLNHQEIGSPLVAPSTHAALEVTADRTTIVATHSAMSLDQSARMSGLSGQDLIQALIDYEVRAVSSPETISRIFSSAFSYDQSIYASGLEPDDYTAHSFAASMPTETTIRQPIPTVRTGPYDILIPARRDYGFFGAQAAGIFPKRVHF